MRLILTWPQPILRAGLDLILSHRKLAITVAVASAVLLWIRHELSRPVALMEVISVPKSFIDGGFTTIAVSSRIIDTISKIDYEVREDSHLFKKERTFRGADEKELPQFEIPGTKVSFKDAVRWLRPLFRVEPTTITVVLATMANSSVAATATIQDPGGYLAVRTSEFDSSDMAAGIDQIAQEILAELDPSKLALFFDSNPVSRSKAERAAGS